MLEWLLRNARLQDDAPLVDIAVQDGTIAEMRPSLQLAAINEWDLAGRVVLPGLVDAHTHLDKAYTTTRNPSGTLHEAIDIWLELKRTRTPADIQATARRALQTAITNGVTAMRSHVDVEDQHDLTTVAALLELREEMRTTIDLQLVVLGSAGGTQENEAALEEAMYMGCDLVGGAPSLMSNLHQSIDCVFALAERLGKPIDLHIDETEDPHMLALEYLAEQTIGHNMQGQVTAGHCCSLAFVDDATAARVMEKVAAAQLNVITLPICNLVLMGRNIAPTPRGITRVKDLLARGVNVCAASDNVHDPFNPFGAFDLLQVAQMNALVAHMSGEAELYTSLKMVTEHPAKALGIAGGVLQPGAVADFVVTDATRLLDVVTALPPRLATFKRGKLVVRQEFSQHWSDDIWI